MATQLFSNNFHPKKPNMDITLSYDVSRPGGEQSKGLQYTFYGSLYCKSGEYYYASNAVGVQITVDGITKTFYLRGIGGGSTGEGSSVAGPWTQTECIPSDGSYSQTADYPTSFSFSTENIGSTAGISVYVWCHQGTYAEPRGGLNCTASGGPYDYTYTGTIGVPAYNPYTEPSVYAVTSYTKIGRAPVNGHAGTDYSVTYNIQCGAGGAIHWARCELYQEGTTWNYGKYANVEGALNGKCVYTDYVLQPNDNMHANGERTTTIKLPAVDHKKYKIAIRFSDCHHQWISGDDKNIYTYTQPLTTATLSTPTAADISSGNYTKRVSPQDNAKITCTARTRGWGKSNLENAFQTFVQIGPKRVEDASVVKDNTATDEIQTWSSEYTLNATGLATYLVDGNTDYRNNAYYDMDMWVNQYSPSADWWSEKIHRYVRMQFRPVKAAISGKVTSDSAGSTGIGGKTLNVAEQSTIYTFWDYASTTGGAGVVSGYSYTIGTGGTGSSFVPSNISGTTSNKNKSFNTSTELVRGKMNYIKIVPYYQSPNGTKYYAQNDNGEEQALYFQLIQPVSTLDAPVIDYPINNGTWHNDSIRVCLQASNDPDFSTLGVTETNYRYGDVEIVINDKKFLRSNANNFTMFSATDTSHKGSLVINIFEGDGFVKASTYTIKVRFKKNYNLSSTDSFNWSPYTTVVVNKTEISELSINAGDIIRATHFNGIRDAINKSCNCYNKTQTTLTEITSSTQTVIDEKEYKTLYNRLNATIDTINNYTTYKLEGATYVKINNTLDQFKVAPTEEETIKAAKNKSVTSATGRNYINLLREAINKLI